MGVPLSDLNGMSLLEWADIVSAWNAAHDPDAVKKLTGDEVAQLAALVDAS